MCVCVSDLSEKEHERDQLFLCVFQNELKNTQRINYVCVFRIDLKKHTREIICLCVFSERIEKHTKDDLYVCFSN